jgi:hypothetical protein
MWAMETLKAGYLKYFQEKARNFCYHNKISRDTRDFDPRGQKKKNTRSQDLAQKVLRDIR